MLFLPESAGVQLHNILQILHRIIHSFNGNVFAWTVECISASSKVRTGQSHKGKSCAICAAADCNCLRIQPDCWTAFLALSIRCMQGSIFSFMLRYCSLMVRVTVPSPYFSLRSLTICLISSWRQANMALSWSRICSQACRRHISAHSQRWKIPHTSSDIGRSISCWKHVVKLHGNSAALIMVFLLLPGCTENL